MIAIRHISKTIQGKRVLEDISLDVDKENILALVGPSGCGKTTLLRLIAGLEIPDAGTITIDGLAASSANRVLPPRKRQLAMIFQNLALWPHMTAHQHLTYVLRQQKLPNRMSEDKIKVLLDAVNLNGHAGRYPHQLSGGEQQRLAIVRALAQGPKYLLMDEPFSNLDPILKEELEIFISRIQRESRIAIVYVTHNMKDLERISHQVAVMQNGRLIQFGGKNDVFRNPANSFVDRLLRI